jgi:hypothetical protein
MPDNGHPPRGEPHGREYLLIGESPRDFILIETSAPWPVWRATTVSFDRRLRHRSSYGERRRSGLAAVTARTLLRPIFTEDDSSGLQDGGDLLRGGPKPGRTSRATSLVPPHRLLMSTTAADTLRRFRNGRKEQRGRRRLQKLNSERLLN